MSADPGLALGTALLDAARGAIAGALGVAGGTGVAPVSDVAAVTALDAPGATFVTLMLRGRLRGCIGTLAPRRSLGDDVRANAVAAAFDDPRFRPLSPREFRATCIEVSLLGTPEPMAVDDEDHACAILDPGRDGVVLDWRGRRATFLPQVWATLPDPVEFLRTLKRKAGLPPDFWAPDLHLERYSVRKWSEPGAPRGEHA